MTQRRDIETLLRSQEKRIYAIAMRLLKQKEDAEDLTQEVLLKLVVEAQKRKPWRDLNAYVYRMVFNMAMNSRKKAQRRDHHEKKVVSQSFAESDEKIDEALVHDHVAMLSEKNRRIILARYYEGQSLKELAKSLDCAVSTAHDRLEKAQNELKKAFQKSGHERCLPALIPFLDTLTPPSLEKSLVNDHFVDQCMTHISAAAPWGATLMGTGVLMMKQKTMQLAVSACVLLGVGFFAGHQMMPPENPAPPMPLAINAQPPHDEKALQKIEAENLRLLESNQNLREQIQALEAQQSQQANLVTDPQAPLKEALAMMQDDQFDQVVAGIIDVLRTMAEGNELNEEDIAKAIAFNQMKAMLIDRLGIKESNPIVNEFKLMKNKAFGKAAIKSALKYTVNDINPSQLEEFDQMMDQQGETWDDSWQVADVMLSFVDDSIAMNQALREILNPEQWEAYKTSQFHDPFVGSDMVQHRYMPKGNDWSSLIAADLSARFPGQDEELIKSHSLNINMQLQELNSSCGHQSIAEMSDEQRNFYRQQSLHIVRQGDLELAEIFGTKPPEIFLPLYQVEDSTDLP